MLRIAQHGSTKIIIVHLLPVVYRPHPLDYGHTHLYNFTGHTLWLVCYSLALEKLALPSSSLALFSFENVGRAWR